MRLPRFVLSLVLCVVIPSPVISQGASGPAYRVLSANRFSTLQMELAQAASEGYRVRAALRPAPAVRAILLERSDDRRQYFVSESVERDLLEGKVPAGYTILEHTLGAIGGGPCGAVFEQNPAAAAGAFRVESAVYPGNLQRDILTAVAAGDRVRVIGAAAGYCALLERAPQASTGAAGAVSGAKEKKIDLGTADYSRPFLVIATSRTATLEKELAAAAARGFRLHSGAAADEFVYLMERADGAEGTREYVVLSTSKADTLERELNQSAAKGYRLHPRSLVGLFRSMSGTFESVAVMEKHQLPAIEYRVIGTARTGTFEKELVSSHAEGWELVATAPSGTFMAILQRGGAR